MLLVPNHQRQAAVKAAWAERQRAAGHSLWHTPRIFTFNQYCERALGETWSLHGTPDRLLPAGAEWAALRRGDERRDAGGSGEARALLTSIRTLADWGITGFSRARHVSPEAELLADALTRLENLARDAQRRPLRAWLADLPAGTDGLCVAGEGDLPAAQRAVLRRLGAQALPRSTLAAGLSIATAKHDQHELEMIGAWCRAQLERDPDCRLLVVDARLRQRRALYERMLSQTLTPSQWLEPAARAPSTAFAIEGGKPLAEFPLIAHALLTLRLLTGRLRFDEIVQWARQPFLDGKRPDGSDAYSGVNLEAAVRMGRRLEYGAAELAAELERAPAAAVWGMRLREAAQPLTASRTPAEWAPRLLAALRALGWPGARPLRSDEQQTLARWHALLDEYSALGVWLTRAAADVAVATLAELAAERNFDAASVAAPVTLTESHGDPIVRYDGIWVAGLDGAQWPPPPKPDVFIPLHLQVAAGVPWASAAGQTRAARASLAAWRAATGSLVCSWAELEGDAQRTPSPLLARVADAAPYSGPAHTPSLAARLHLPQPVPLEDVRGVPVDTQAPVQGGTKPLTLQAECGFRAYGEVRLAALPLEVPIPGIDPRDRGTLLHKALELVWRELEGHGKLVMLDARVLGATTIPQAVQAAIVAVFHGYVPPEIRAALERERHRLERLIHALLEVERTRSAFDVESLETRREVSIGGGTFEVRIDRIDRVEGGHAILDYKTGEPRPLGWDEERPREPQLLAYLMAERGRDVQALASVSLTRNRARFSGKSARKGLLPGVNGLNPSKEPSEKIDAAWRDDTGRWLHALQMLAAEYLSGTAPVRPGNVCRTCQLTVLCRRVELSSVDIEEAP